MESFGNYLKHLRESRGLTVNQLAMYSGISAATISRIETGKRGTPKPPTIQKLADALKAPYEDLMKAAGYIHEEKNDDPQPLDEDMAKKVADIEATLNSGEWKINGQPVPKKLIDDILAYVRIQTTKDK